MKRLRSDGFTIVELLVTIIVGVILAASLSLISTAHTRLSKRNRSLNAVTAYVTNKVEALRSKGYLALTSGTTSLNSELPAELNGKSGSMVISDYASGIKEIDISISYNDQGTNRTYSYTTFVGELGVGQY